MKRGNLRRARRRPVARHVPTHAFGAGRRGERSFVAIDRKIGGQQFGWIEGRPLHRLGLAFMRRGGADQLFQLGIVRAFLKQNAQHGEVAGVVDVDEMGDHRIGQAVKHFFRRRMKMDLQQLVARDATGQH